MSNTRVPLPADQLYVLDAAGPTSAIVRKLIDFNTAFQMRGFRYFAWLKLAWEKRNPGRSFPGLCAEVDSITGRMRPLADQRA
ncbi:MAG: hypothetical protein ABIF71_12810 [Planctomycetota bacterium]